MRIVKTYSWNNGLELMKKNHPKELKEIINAIRSVDSRKVKVKQSKEKTKKFKMLFSPIQLNKAILDGYLYKRGWTKPKVILNDRGGFIEGDGVKNGVGLEVQFGKYAFMGWDIFGKMVIFAKTGNYKIAVEVVPVREFTKDMSTGVSYFEQIESILERRGVSNLDIPVAVLGIGD